MARRRRQAERFTVVRLKKGFAIRWTRNGGRTWEQESLGIPAGGSRSKAIKLASDRARELFIATGHDVTWEAFCERYESEWLSGLASGTAEAWKTCRNTVADVLAPQFLADVDASALSKLAAALRRRGLAESTIKSRLAGISAALGWARGVGFISAVPEIPKPPRARGVRRRARSRPVTGEEYERMLASVGAGLLAVEHEKRDKRRENRQPKRKLSDAAKDDYRRKQLARVESAAPRWRRFIEGLWLSGLRLDEGLRLSWEWGGDFAVDFTARRPQFRIKVKGHKGARDQLCPMAPEFARFLLAIPESERRGRVFGLTCSQDHAGRVIAAIGRKAGVVVNTERKTATAHDLRRSFGTRWAIRVQPAILKELMRHRQISTTMEYYVDIDDATIAEELWRHVPDEKVDQKSDPENDASETRIAKEPQPPEGM